MPAVLLFRLENPVFEKRRHRVRVHSIVYLAVKKGNILVNILLLKIFFANYCHIQLFVFLTRFMRVKRWSIQRMSYTKKLIFLLKKR